MEITKGPVGSAKAAQRGEAREMGKVDRTGLVRRIGLCIAILAVGVAAAVVTGSVQNPVLAELPGGDVQVARAAYSDVAYAAVGSGTTAIYRSEDGGSSWRRAGAGPEAVVNALAVNPADTDLVYAGTAGGPAGSGDSLWVSEDAGRTWKASALRLPASPDGVVPEVTSLAADPNYPGVLYVGTRGQGVYEVHNDQHQGYGYELVGGVSPVANGFVSDIVLGADGAIYAATASGLFASDGEAWERLPVPEAVASLAASTREPGLLYAGGVSMGAYRSTDGGRTWEAISGGLEPVPGAALRVTAVAVDPRDPGHVAAATAYGIGGHLAPVGVYESADAGESWARVAEPVALVTGLTVEGSAIQAATGEGLARYGEAKAAPETAMPVIQLLADPTAIQVAIIVLAGVLAGLVLTGWIGRILGPGRPAA